MPMDQQRTSFLSLKQVLRDTNSRNVSAGLIASTLLMTGPAAILLDAAARGGFTLQETISWLFAVHVFGGLFGILLSLYYKKPITGGHSITGIAFLATVTMHFRFSELVGGYMMAALLMLIVGASGFFTKMIQWVPKEVIAAMLGGLIMSYVARMIPALPELPLVGAAALLVFFVLTKWNSRFPPIMSAVVVAFIVLFLQHGVQPVDSSIPFMMPSVYMPEFSVATFFTLSIPLALLILSNDAAPAIGALESEQFQPPVRTIVSASGVFSFLAGLFGGQCSNVAGMMTAICADPSSGPKKQRYIGSVVSGIITVLFGVFAWKIAPFIQSLPVAFVALLTGISLIGALQSSLTGAFSTSRYRLSAMAAFVISLSNVSFFHVSGPVWALLVGAAIAWTVERTPVSL